MVFIFLGIPTYRYHGISTNSLQNYNKFLKYANFCYFFRKKGQIRHGNNVLITHSSTPAKAAFIVPNTTIAQAPLTPTSAIGTFGVIVTNR